MATSCPTSKRNQVEWALWHLIDRGRMTLGDPPILLVHQIKRLIDVDRQMGIDPDAGERWQHRYAFLAGPPQGTGGENAYRLPEVVALWLGVQLLHMGLPQREIIEFLRTLKPRLDQAVREVAQPHVDSIARVAQHRSVPMATKLRTADYLEPADHVYLVAEEISASGAEVTARRPLGSVTSNICAGQRELLRYIETYVARSKRFVVIEFANAVLTLLYLLFMAPVKGRGRVSRMMEKI
jgi:hypothetical protein